MTWEGVVAITAISSAAVAARAEDGELRVAVIGLGDCTASDGALGRQVQRFAEASTRAGARVVSVDELRTRFGFAAEATADAVYQEIEKGCSAHFNGKSNLGEEGLRRAVELARRVPPSVRRREAYLEAMVWLAMMQHARMNGPGADQTLRLLLAHAPAYELDRKWFPPTFRERFDGLKGALATSSATWPELRVEAPGAEAEAWVDGCPIGPTPARIRLPPGAVSDVAAVVQGQPTGTRTVTVERDVVVSIAHAQDEASLQFEGPCIGAGPDRPSQYAALGRIAARVGAARVAALSVERSSGVAFLEAIVIEDGQVARQGRIRMVGLDVIPADREALAAFTWFGRPHASVATISPPSAPAVVPAAAAVVARPPEARAHPAAGGGATVSKILPGVAIGVGVAAAAGGTLLFLSGEEAQRSANGLVDGQGFVGKSDADEFLRRQGDADAKRALGIAGGVVGVLGIAAGATFVVLGPTSPGAGGGFQVGVHRSF